MRMEVQSSECFVVDSLVVLPPYTGKMYAVQDYNEILNSTRVSS